MTGPSQSFVFEIKVTYLNCMCSLQLGLEFIQNKGVYLKGQTWKSDGCQFYFPGANADPLNICPAMSRPDCYVYNGAVCCASECPGKYFGQVCN